MVVNILDHLLSFHGLTTNNPFTGRPFWGGGIGLQGLDPRFLDDPRYAPLQRKLTPDKLGQGRGWIVQMGPPGDPDTVERMGGWDTAPVGLGNKDDWTVGKKGITSRLTVDMPDRILANLMSKLAVSPKGSNLGTDEQLGQGRPNTTDDWMYDTVKRIVGNNPRIVPSMIRQFRERLLNDPGHRAEMMY